jgi:cystathionine beta-lyase/cystathionine gamma-synthase
MDTLLHLLKKGDRVVCEEDVYAGTRRMLDQVFAPLGIRVEYRDFSSEDAFSPLPSDTRLVWVETPTNPLLKVIDIARVAELAHRSGAWLAVDNTFATPALQQPLDEGADFSVYSTTKYLSGHSDVVGGAIVTRDATLYERLKYLQNAVGAVPSPMDAFLILRGLRTLHLRMKAHSENARKVVEALRDHPRIRRVYYTDTSSVAQRQMRDTGGMVSVDLQGDFETVVTFLQRLKIFQLAESFGGVESLINHPARMTHAYLPREDREKRGVTETLLRLSVGIEDPDDLVQDLLEALA